MRKKSRDDDEAAEWMIADLIWLSQKTYVSVDRRRC